MGQPLYEHRFWAGYWTYPPFGALVMTPLTVLPLNLLFPVWTGLSLFALFAVVGVSFKDLLAQQKKPHDRALLTIALAVMRHCP